ncbi:MAG: ABC transporter, phosphonate, periplasmic substrate-binding protein [Tenericutes bacterium ADurb.BinA155]|jgi:phosphonate transport system substrate-binding protein|nr:MAG: ABC transporter, phosphonate, periplasmic substrate-binding protein [Tenericutes bacterium ADurb.BinA155]
MKKTISSLFIMGGLVAVAALTGCDSPKEDIHLQLVPSNDPAKLLTLATQLKPFLDSYVSDSGYSFTIDVGATYAATTTALAAGQIDGGFLTASGYAQESIENPGKVDVLLSAARAGYKVQADDFPGFDAAAKAKQLAAMNGEIGADGNAISSSNPAYVYKGDQSSTQVSYYSGIIITLRDSARAALNLPALDADGDGKTTIKEIHDAKGVIGRMGATSGAGYIYPTKYLFDNGYTLGFKSKDDYNALSDADKEKAVIGVDQTSYPNAVSLLMTGAIDAACGFMDIRYGSAYVQTDGKYYHDDTLFSKGYTVGITDPIMNDTLSVTNTLSTGKRDAIKKAFKKAVTEGSKTEEGTAAYLIYQIYSHTGYVDAKDSDFDSAREMYKWSVAHSN